MGAARVETREPLVPLLSVNSQDLGLQSLAKSTAKNASTGAPPTAKAEPIKPSLAADSFVSRGPAKPTSSPQPTAADPDSTVEIFQPVRRSMENQEADSDATSLSAPHNRSTMNGDRSHVAADDEEESKSLLQLEIEAMTWAALAKDDAISSLERRLRQALEIAQAEQHKNQALQAMLLQSRAREEGLKMELRDASEEIGQLIEAEERLCVQLGDLEAEAAEEARRFRFQIQNIEKKHIPMTVYQVDRLGVSSA